MRKYWLVLLMLAVALSACTPAATAAPTQENTATSAPATATTAPAATTSSSATCQPFVLLDQVIPAADPRLPAVTDSDWTVGPSTALVTIVDYSDYQ